MVRGRRDPVWRVVVPPVLFTVALGSTFAPDVFHVERSAAYTAVGIVAAVGMFAFFALASRLDAKRTGVAILPNRDISERSRNTLMKVDVVLGAVCAAFAAAYGMAGFVVALTVFAWIHGGMAAWMRRK
ncbi:hypothetical protein [Streptomyces sp. NPDC001401]|uniref:hypothetical protein n=1 Tax=Streptomyces sp. NPDC001401 TaxID=3364570 RepID=UPI0036C97357